MSGPQPRAAQRVEAEALAALHGACFPDEPWDAGAFAELLAMPGAAAYVLPGDGGLDGLVLLRRAADEAEIVTLAVAPQARRRGSATALLCHGLAVLAAAGARRAFLEVAEDNAAARGLYQRLGFAICGRRAGYYRRDGRPPADALVLAVALPLDLPDGAARTTPGQLQANDKSGETK